MEKQLKKTIGFLPALATVMGTVIGAGVFFKAAIIYKTTGNMSIGLLAWLLGGVITICAGLTAAELAAAIPETGGMVVWIERTYGKLPAYLLGWAQTVIYFPANIAALAIIFSTQVLNLLGLEDSWHVPIAIITAISVTLINLLGSKAAGSLQTIATLGKLIPLILIIIFGLFNNNPQTVSLLPASSDFNSSTVTALGSALLATMFAYDGWINVGNMAGEMKNPKRDLPRAILFGLFSIMIVYILINIAFLLTLPLDSISGNQNAASDVATILFGSMGGKIVTIGILISVYGTINGYTMTGIRIPFAMANDKQIPLPNFWSKLNKNSIPHNSAFLILIISIVMIFSKQFDMLTDLLLFVIWFFYTATFCAVLVLRKKEPELERPYKVPLYPIIPFIAILGGAYILINTLFTQTTLALGGIVLTLIGLFFYSDFIKKFKK